MKTTAYSYVRFSTPEQSKGDSLARQTAAAVAYCERKAWTLDTTLNLRDLGVSAFRGDNALVGNLGIFLDAVARGKVKPGSALIVESIDRISRQGIDEGYDLCKRIIKSGILLVTLMPEREFDISAVKSLSRGALELLLILERAAEESETKSKRVGGAWQKKKELARQGKAQQGRGPVEGMACITHKLPAWIEERGGTLHLIADRAAAVRRMFNLAASGYSAGRIAKLFRAEGVPTMGRSHTWLRSYIAQILTERRALGEHQPMDKNHKPDGEPIPDYFPAAITEQDWLAARAVIVPKRLPPTRITDRVTLFAGLWIDARHGSQGFYRNPAGKKRTHDVMVNNTFKEGLAPAYSFPLEVFEAAILSLLAEVDPQEVMGGEPEPDESAALAAEIEHVEDKIAKLEATLLDGNIATIAKVLKAQEARLAELKGKLAEARQKALRPLADTWDETQSLLALLEDADDVADVRLRIRAALRRIVESIIVLIVPRGLTRFAAVQIHFAGGGRRDYLITNRAAKAYMNRRTKKVHRVDGGWKANAVRLDDDDKRAGKELDLRKPDHVKRLERALLKMELVV